MKKKLIAIVMCALCAAFAMCVLVGCGGGDKAASSSSSSSSSAKVAATLPGAEIGQPDGWKVDVVTKDENVKMTNEKASNQTIEVKYVKASYGKAEKAISLDAENAEKEMQTTTIDGHEWYYYEGYSGLIMAVDLSDGRLNVTVDDLTLDEATPVLEQIKIK